MEEWCKRNWWLMPVSVVLAVICFNGAWQNGAALQDVCDELNARLGDEAGLFDSYIHCDVQFSDGGW